MKTEFKLDSRRIAISTARDTKYTSCTEEYAKSNPGFHSYAVARLLPKEEFKPAQPTPNFPKGGTTFTESAYKEFEGKDLHIVTPESSEPHEDRFNQALREVPQDIKDQVEFEHNAINEAWELWGNIAKKDNVNPQAFVFGYVEAKKKYAVSAPSESQEEIWKNEGLSETKNKAMENNKPDFESLLDYIDDQYLLNFNKGLIDLNELEKRTRNAIELYIESENKALREENTRLTTKFIEEEHVAESPNDHLSYWQYQQFTRAAITKLKEEISQLKAEVLKEKFPEN